MDSLELQQRLDELSSWRKRELSLARALAESAESDAATKYLCRAWTMIMYAHCDNFLKESTKYYIQHLKMHRRHSYKAETIWFMFKGKLNATEAAEDKYISLSSAIERFEMHFQTIEGDEVFKKRSFRYKTLRFFCDWILQVDYPYQEMKLFCENLEEKRNAIAHGEEAYVESINDCLQWHEYTIKFMDELKDSILSHCN